MSNSAGDDNNSHTSSGMPAITEQTRRNRRPAAQRRAAKTIAKLTGNGRPHHTYQRPRPTLWFVVRRTWGRVIAMQVRSEEHTSELQSRFDLVCRLLLEKKDNSRNNT